MDWLNVVIMGIGLAMDCCAVSAVQGLHQGKWHPRALLMAAIFGCFHMGMPVIGYFAGKPVRGNHTDLCPLDSVGVIGTFGHQDDLGVLP